MKHPVLHLHAGLRKTGSTAIQNFLFDNDVDPRFHYLHTGMANSSLVTGQAFRAIRADDPRFPRAEQSEAEIREKRIRARKSLSSALGSMTRPHAIFSAETVGILRAEELASLRDFFAPSCQHIRIYLYLRPHKSRMESVFQERLKHHYTDLSESFPMNLKRIVGRFDDTFGPERITLSRFAREDFPNGSIINHFLQLLGIAQSLPDVGKDNSALSLRATQLLFIYRKFFPNHDEADPARIEQLRELTGKPLRFHSELYARLQTSQADDVQWVEQRAGFSLKEDINADDSTGIRSEQDLIDIPQQSLEWLRNSQPGLLARLRFRSRKQEDIAKAVRRLA
ncbi:MAG: hypothetical protein AAGA91_08080 [Pseudomonadota bacterium]